jgi:hypothetical protein
MRPEKQAQRDKGRRADHCTIGSSDETMRMCVSLPCVSLPFGSIDESISVESVIVGIQIR